jgi:hypothetical protein
MFIFFFCVFIKYPHKIMKVAEIVAVTGGGLIVIGLVYLRLRLYIIARFIQQLLRALFFQDLAYTYARNKSDRIFHRFMAFLLKYVGALVLIGGLMGMIDWNTWWHSMDRDPNDVCYNIPQNWASRHEVPCPEGESDDQINVRIWLFGIGGFVTAVIFIIVTLVLFVTAIQQAERKSIYALK